jgi:hypothetical protein
MDWRNGRRNLKEDRWSGGRGGWIGGRDEGIRGKDRRIRVGTYGLEGRIN